MNRKMGFESLPFEVLELVLRCDVISYKDLCRLSTVSKLFYSVGQDNRIWQRKFVQMWPSLFPLVAVPGYDVNWRSQFCMMVKSKKWIHKKLHQTSVECYNDKNVSDEYFSSIFSDIFNGHPLIDHIVIVELENIVHCEDSHKNLTMKYYAMRALRFMRHKILQNSFQELLSENLNKLTLLKGACLISKWCQPIQLGCTENVCSEINMIIQSVHRKLRSSYPKHPASLKEIPVVKSEDDGEPLTDSLWSSRDCKSVLCAIVDVLFKQMGFRGNVDLFASASHSFIDEVLKMKFGIPVTLGIIFEVVASKLGVRVFPVNFPGRFLLKWKENPTFCGPEAFTFIDLYEEGEFKTYAQMYDLSPGYDTFSPTWLEGVSTLKVLVRMCWNIVEIGRQRDSEEKGMLSLCDALELLYLLKPDDVEHKLLLARLYTHLCINVKQVIHLLQEASEEDPNSASVVSHMYRTVLATSTMHKKRHLHRTAKEMIRSRDENCPAEFAIGMVMKHLKYGYRCVIYGWDATCAASENWIKQMCVDVSPKQPFYNVLAEDGTVRYAAQENLSLDASGEMVSHCEVGKYFDSFHGWYYEPNELKRQQYPQDEPVREGFRTRAAQQPPVSEDVAMC